MRSTEAMDVPSKAKREAEKLNERERDKFQRSSSTTPTTVDDRRVNKTIGEYERERKIKDDKEAAECGRYSDYLHSIFKPIQLEDNYEMVFHPRMNVREGVSFSDPAIFGSFILHVKIDLSEKDFNKLPSDLEDFDKENPLKSSTSGQFAGNLNIFTNKMLLTSFKNFMTTQVKFNGVISQVIIPLRSQYDISYVISSFFLSLFSLAFFSVS
jgi:hypothetical protein